MNLLNLYPNYRNLIRIKSITSDVHILSGEILSCWMLAFLTLFYLHEWIMFHLIDIFVNMAIVAGYNIFWIKLKFLRKHLHFLTSIHLLKCIKWSTDPTFNYTTPCTDTHYRNIYVGHSQNLTSRICYYTIVKPIIN